MLSFPGSFSTSSSAKKLFEPLSQPHWVSLCYAVATLTANILVLELEAVSDGALCLPWRQEW